MARVRKLAIWSGAAVLLLVALVAVGAYTLLQTRTGHDFVLRTALQQTPRFVNGEVEIAGLRSDGLLRGFTLRGIVIRDERGRPFLEADSVRVRYSARELVRRRIALVPAEIWAPRVVLERLHGDEESNVGRIFPTGEPDPDAGPSGFALSLRDMTIHDGSFLVRLPAGDDVPRRMVSEEVEGFPGLHRRFEFSRIDAHIREAVILNPDRDGETIHFERLSLEGRVFEDAFVLEELRGRLDRIGSRLTLDADRIWFPESELSGLVALDWGGDEVILEAGIAADPVRLSDFRWIEPRLPDGEGRLTLQGRGPVTSGRWTARNAELDIGGSRLRGSIGIDLGDELRFTETDLELAPLQLALLDPWLEEPLPFGGRLEGRLSAEGPLSALHIDGRVRYDDPAEGIPASTAGLHGFLHIGELFGVTDLSVTIDPLRLPTLQAFFPELELHGEGRLAAELSGRLSTGVRLTADLVHGIEGGGDSRVTTSGSVREIGGELRLALDASLAPLSLDGLALALARELPISGDLQGPVRVEGFLTELGLDGRLQTPAGLLVADATLDVTDPFRRYRAEGRVTEFELHTIFTDLPEPTTVTGRFFVDGRGGTAQELSGEARVEFTDSRWGEVQVDRLRADLRAQGGLLTVEELELESPMGSLQGGGDLALRDGVPEGEISITWAAESFAAFRPLVFGPEPINVDTLTSLERLILQEEGVDFDTIPAGGLLALDGSAHGELTVEGSVPSLRAHGWAEVAEVVYGEGSLSQGRVDFVFHREGGEDWAVEGVADLEAFAWDRWAFMRGSVEAAYRPREGTVRLDLQRAEEESYRARGSFVVDSLAVSGELAQLVFDLDDVEWSLEEPTGWRFAESAIEVERLRISRPPEEGTEPVRMEVRGILAFEGDSDFHVELVGVDLDRLGRIAQLETFPRGFLDLDMAVRGPHLSPRMDGGFVIHEFAFDGGELSRVEGTLEYADRLVVTSVEADLEGRRLLHLEGRVPADLSFQSVADRFPDREVDLTLTVDSLPAATVLAYFEFLDDVQGTLDGRIQLRGTPQELRPSGTIGMRNGALTLPELGLRPEGITADIEIREDRSISVRAEALGRGTARVEGTIDLAEVADPRFDLRIATSGFQAVDRRDLNARIGGEVTLTGRFTQPRIGGRVRVEQGVLFLEEIARTAEVVDLSDPRFFDVVDTSLVAVRQVVAAAQNPFLQNLRVDVDLDIQRDFWLRSREMNVEMGGSLIVAFDRQAEEIILVGTLEAIRGSYNAFGRTFQVQEGTVEFMGTPGINPSMNIQAVNRLRREGGDPLNIIAQVEGTLMNLRVGLSTDAQPPIAESDLISYLIFGRPSYALASGESSVLAGAAGAGVTAGIGTIAGQLGSAVARQFGVDYLAITQTRDGSGIGSAAGLGGTFADTQVEVGQYVGQDLFLALILRPLTGLGGSTQSQLPGARLEWRFTDLWTAEGFVEDRFAREGASGFGELGVRLSRVFGLSLYREWGY